MSPSLTRRAITGSCSIRKTSRSTKQQPASCAPRGARESAPRSGLDRRRRFESAAPRGVQGGVMRFYRLIGRPVTAAVLVTLGVLVARAPTRAAEPLRFGRGFPSLFQFTPIDVGVAEGIFKKHGLDIEISAFAGDAKLQQAFAAGAVDIGVGSGPGM